ncbi:hypothetical protein R6Q59_036004 [Mikania micrantha]
MAFATGKESAPSTSCTQPSVSCRRFEFPEILIATENFSESLVIGRGGFGKVYKGNIINGSSVVVAAIKRLDSMSNQGPAEFWAEVEMLSMLRHCNLVSLIGYCNYEQEMILVYEYNMPNSTLNDHLHELRTPLSWLQRLNICIGTGRGLHYLHTGTGIASGVIHRDVKSSNILLHESWAAKISGFGLSKIGPTNQPSTYVNTLIKGTFGYLDPNYYATGKLTRKSDVYAFGVVLLEVLCRKRAVDKSLDEEQWGLVAWVQDSIKEGNLKNIIDSDIRGEISPKCLKEYVKLAERCLHNSPKHRPTMAEILFSLESVMAIQERFNNSFQYASRTLFGRMVNLFPFPSNQENSVQGDLNLSTTSKGNNMLPHMKEVPAHFPSPSPILKEFRLSDLEKTTGSFSPDLILGEGGFGKAQQRKPSRSCRMAKKNLSTCLFTSTWRTKVLIAFYSQDFNAKLRNFGMMRCGPETGETHVTTSVRGTIGYIAPEYYATGQLTAKCDIYGLGVVLLESITGRKAMDAKRPKGQQRLAEWATRVGSNLKNIMDPRLEGNYPQHLASEYVALALRCVADNPKDRPSGEEVLQSLEQMYAKQILL